MGWNVLAPDKNGSVGETPFLYGGAFLAAGQTAFFWETMIQARSEILNRGNVRLLQRRFRICYKIQVLN
jgi:hypothetical protein